MHPQVSDLLMPNGWKLLMVFGWYFLMSRLISMGFAWCAPCNAGPGRGCAFSCEMEYSPILLIFSPLIGLEGLEIESVFGMILVMLATVVYWYFLACLTFAGLKIGVHELRKRMGSETSDRSDNLYTGLLVVVLFVLLIGEVTVVDKINQDREREAMRLRQSQSFGPDLRLDHELSYQQIEVDSDRYSQEDGYDDIQARKIEEIRASFETQEWVDVEVTLIDLKNLQEDYQLNEWLSELDQHEVDEAWQLLDEWRQFDGARRVSEVLASLTEKDFKLGFCSQFDYFFSGSLSQAGLEKLLQNPEVGTIGPSRSSESASYREREAQRIAEIRTRQNNEIRASLVYEPFTPVSVSLHVPTWAEHFDPCGEFDFGTDAFQKASLAHDERRKIDGAEKIAQVLSTLSEEDFKLKYQSDLFYYFSGEVSQTGLEKLLRNPLVEALIPPKSGSTF